MKMYFVGCDDCKRVHEWHVPGEVPAGAMISANYLKKRKMNDFNAEDCPWILDSGAFSQITDPKNMGDFEMSPREYVALAKRFEHNGNLQCIVSQDYMCEPEVIELLTKMGYRKPGLNWVRKHQEKTVERFVEVRDEAIRQELTVPVMPVLQGWEVRDYVEHFKAYEELLDMPYVEWWPSYYRPGEFLPRHRNWNQWLGIGSTCKRNKNPEVLSDILSALWDYWEEHYRGASSNLKEGFRIHAFGYKKTGLKLSSVKDRLFSADSFAHDFADRYEGKLRDRASRARSARRAGQEIIHNTVQLDLNLTKEE
mgnify:CR=1 FL=1